MKGRSDRENRNRHPVAKRRGAARRRGRVLGALLPPVIAGVVLVVAWEGIVRAWSLPKLILPSPWDVVAAGAAQRRELLGAFVVTLTEVLVAYAASLIVGGLTAILFAQFRPVRAALYPYAVFLKTLPIIAIAPLIVIWIGHGFWAVVAVAGLVSFLPILTNMTEGLLAVPAPLQDLLRLYGASRVQRLIKLQLPNSLPFLVAGCKIASVGCVLGAVVGEIFVGVVSRPGLGWTIYEKRDTDVSGMFVAILLSGLLGIALFFATSIIGDRLLLYWRDPTVDERR